MSKPIGSIPLEIQASFRDGEAIPLGTVHVDLIAAESPYTGRFEIAADLDELRNTIQGIFASAEKDGQ